MNQEAIERRAEGYSEVLPTFGEFDPVDSTFRWEIYFDASQKAKKPLYGYSKGIDVAENDDKYYVVKSRLLESIFINNGYYKKIDKIQLHFNESGYSGEKVFTLYKTHYELHQYDDELEKMLERTYKRIDTLQNQPQKTMSSVFKKRSKKIRTAQTKSPTDGEINLAQCRSLKEFNELITRLKAKNYPPGLIQDLKRKIREMHPDWLAQPVSQKSKKETYQVRRTDLLRKWGGWKEKVREDYPDLSDDFQRLRFGTIQGDKLTLNPENSEHWKRLQNNTEMSDLLRIIAKDFKATDVGFSLPEAMGNLQKKHQRVPSSAKTHYTVWENCLQTIQENVGNQTFEQWFKPIIPVKFENNILTIKVPSQFFYEWLEEHYVQVLRKAIHLELGKNGRLQYSMDVNQGGMK